MADEDHDFARSGVEKRVREGSGDTPQSSVGVEEGGSGVETDSHRSQHATSSVRWSVVIPTKAGWAQLARTLPPLLAALGTDDEVVIVGDGSDPGLPDGIGPHCRIVVHRGQRGFAPACNRGAADARGERLLFLNDDVVVAQGVLETLERELARPGIGAVGPNVMSEALGRSESGTSLRWRRGVLDSRQDRLDGSGVVPVPYLCGAAFAMRRDDFARLGGFDVRLAPYFWEDVDLSIRVRERIGAAVVATAATVLHRHGATVGAEPERERRAVYERNRLLVSWKRLRGWRWLAHLGWLPLRIAASLVRDRAVLAGFARAVALSGGKRSRDAGRG